MTKYTDTEKKILAMLQRGLKDLAEFPGDNSFEHGWDAGWKDLAQEVIDMIENPGKYEEWLAEN